MLARATVAVVTLALGIALSQPTAAQTLSAERSVGPTAQADMIAQAEQPAAPAVNQLLNWVVATADNSNQPFIIIDKISARVFVFDPGGRPLGMTTALLGAARGDDSAPGIGERKLSLIRTEERTTPAGRFVARVGTASANHQVLWVDYATSLSLHPVVSSNIKERRLQRLQSPSAEDNRVTYGCINVPASFYRNVVRPLFTNAIGIVYILPETKALRDVFPTFREAPLTSHSEALH